MNKHKFLIGGIYQDEGVDDTLIVQPKLMVEMSEDKVFLEAEKEHAKEIANVVKHE